MKYDIAVIGGGIHGVGIAQAAAIKGLSVAVIEKSGLASGTSSRSSKLIHGGLRYLESAQFSLVRECLQERQILLEIAPHLVKLKKFYLPVYQETTRQATSLHLGLLLYGVFTGAHKAARYRKVPRSQWSTLDGLNIQGLKHVFQYWDAQTDDALLTQAVMQSAIDHGARLYNHTTLKMAKRLDTGWQLEIDGDVVVDKLECKVLINAGGPWVNQILNNIEKPHEAEQVDLVQGTHIICDVPHNGDAIYYLEAPKDRRAVFVMPWYGQTMIGTTETLYTGNPDNVKPLDEEIEYLLETAAHYFPVFAGRGKGCIQSSFAGLRVLPAGGAAFSRPRETILKTDNDDRPALLSIYGGKLTAYRATAEKVMQRLISVFPEADFSKDTRKIKLPELS